MFQTYGALIGFGCLAALSIVDGSGLISEQIMGRVWSGAFGVVLLVIGGWLMIYSFKLVPRRR